MAQAPREKISKFVRGQSQGSEEDVHKVSIKNGKARVELSCYRFRQIPSMSQSSGHDLWDLAFSNVGREDHGDETTNSDDVARAIYNTCGVGPAWCKSEGATGASEGATGASEGATSASEGATGAW